jgi:DNA-binding response OmpR family regulator
MTRPSQEKKQKTKELILIIEDDKPLREGLAMNLRFRKYRVITASDGEEGMRMAFDEAPDLIVLDLMMPSWSGLDILEELRKRGEDVLVLILSARNTTTDKVRGLELGADDYMSKPFDLPELIARIEAMLRRRRTEEESASPEIELEDLVVNRTTREVRLKGKKIDLSAKEFDLLCLLASSPGQVFNRETILEQVWGWGYEGSARTVDNFVASLRKKIQPNKRSRRYIRTVPKVGYKLEA